MPITTRTIAKGVPPRVHETKGKTKAKPQAKQANTTKPSRKWVASKLESKSEEAEDEAKLTRRAKKKQNTTHHRSEEPQSEVELVEDDAEPPEEEVESMDETHSSREVPDEQEVSTGYLFERDAHRHLGWWPQWPSTWCQPWRKTRQEGFDAWSPHNNVRQGHCEV